MEHDDLLDVIGGALLMQQFSNEPVTIGDARDWFEDQRGDVKDNLRRKAREIINLIHVHPGHYRTRFGGGEWEAC